MSREDMIDAAVRKAASEAWGNTRDRDEVLRCWNASGLHETRVTEIRAEFERLALKEIQSQ